MRTMLLRLVLFYVGAITVLVGVIPWTEIQPGQSITVSPFVRVFDVMHVPIAAQIVNFVVLTAALSGMNCCLYLATRMIFSLARAGYAPEALGRVSRHGAPVPALMISAFGLAIATLVAILFPGSAYVYMFGIALFGGLFVWLMIFVTHLFFRRKWEEQGGRTLPVRMPLFPVTTIIGALAVLAIIISTWWVDGMRTTMESGIPWLIALSALYAFSRRRKSAAASSKKLSSFYERRRRCP
jgi:L-asparagine transporter-like permease